MTPSIEQKIQEAADAQFEKQFYENGETGFLSKPYSRYRYHNGFVDGARFGVELCEGEKSYPTVWAYEQACKALEAKDRRIARLEEALENSIGQVDKALSMLNDCRERLNLDPVEFTDKTSRQALAESGET
jgi:exonuclease VII small subunit